jgi:hypothetical protein
VGGDRLGGSVAVTLRRGAVAVGERL